VVVVLASAVLFAALALAAARHGNERAHKLGRLLQLSHPEWN
jgi:hypothetical protein